MDASDDDVLRRGIELSQRGLPSSKLPTAANVNGSPHRKTQPNRNTLAQNIICEYGPDGMRKMREALTKPRVNTAVISTSVDAWGRFRGIQIRQTWVCHASPVEGELPDDRKIWQGKIRPVIIDIKDRPRDQMDPTRIRARTIKSPLEDKDDGKPPSFRDCVSEREAGEGDLGAVRLPYAIDALTHPDSETDLSVELEDIAKKEARPNDIKTGLRELLKNLEGSVLRDPTYSVVRWSYGGHSISAQNSTELLDRGLEDVVFEDDDYYNQSVSRSLDGIVQFMDIDISVVARRFAGLGDENSSPEPPKRTSHIEFVLAAAGAVGGAVLEEVLLGQALQRSKIDFQAKVMMNARWGPVIRMGSIFALVIVDLLPLVYVLNTEVKVAAWTGDVALGSVGISLYGGEDKEMRGGGIAVGMVSCLLWLKDARVELAASLLAVAVLMHICVIGISVYRKTTRRQAIKKAETERQRRHKIAGLEGPPGGDYDDKVLVKIHSLDQSGNAGVLFDEREDMETQQPIPCAPVQSAFSELGRHITLESPRNSRLPK